MHLSFGPHRCSNRGMARDSLGERICILGPSNSGKSTLAVAIGKARGLPVVHLDLLHHLPDTDWEPRPAAEFEALHDAAVGGDRWVIEGNYTRLLPQRLARATGLILLDLDTATCLYRYVRRCWFEPARVGALQGARDRVTLEMLHHIAVVQRRGRSRYRDAYAQCPLPKRALLSKPALAEFYAAEGLTR